MIGNRVLDKTQRWVYYLFMMNTEQMGKQGTLKIERVKWLPSYRGATRWAAEAKDLGFIAITQEGTDCGILRDGAFDMIDAKFKSYTHRLYEKNGSLFIIGDVRNYPVSYPLYQVTL